MTMLISFRLHEKLTQFVVGCPSFRLCLLLIGPCGSSWLVHIACSATGVAHRTAGCTIILAADCTDVQESSSDQLIQPGNRKRHPNKGSSFFGGFPESDADPMAEFLSKFFRFARFGSCFHDHPHKPWSGPAVSS